MARQTPHLLRRGAVYYWRKRLSAPLDTLLRRSHYCVSLHTTDYQIAVRLARRLTVAFDGVEGLIGAMKKKKTLPTYEQVAIICKTVVDDIVKPFMDKSLRSHHEFVPRRYDNEPINQNDYFEKPEAFANLVRDNLALNNFGRISPSLDRALDEQNLKLDPQSEQYLTIARVIGQRVAEILENVASVETGEGLPKEINALEHYFPYSGSDGKTPASKTLMGWTARDILARSQTITELAEKYFRDSRVSSSEKRPKTYKDNKLALRFFVELIGDLPLSEITKEKAKKFSLLLRQIPKNNGKGIYTVPAASCEKDGMPNHATKSMPIRQAIKLANLIRDALDNEKEIFQIGGKVLSKKEMERLTRRLSPKTINKHLSFFTTLYHWDGTPESIQIINPFRGLLITKSEQKRAKIKNPKRRGFQDDELENLFSSPIWTGAVAIEPRWKRGEPTAERPLMLFWDAMFWVPLIGLYMGMRREEICSMRASDIAITQKVKVIRVRGDGDKSAKTFDSIRDIPIHDVLFKIGFEKFVEEMSDKERLFPELTPDADGTSGDSFYGSFKRYMDRFIEPTGELVIHSFRHTFITLLSHAGVKNADIRQIVGHEQTGIVDANYRGMRSPQDLREIINTVDPGLMSLRLNHLYRENCTLPVVITYREISEFKNHHERRKYRNRLSHLNSIPI